jgi:ribulose-phosphate 3-epimerase
VHQEASVHLHRTVQSIREAGAKPGVTINPSTPVAHLEHVLPDVEMALIMSVNPGFGGQRFIPEALNKVGVLKNMLEERSLSTLIEIDGGIKPDNAAEAVKAGARVLVMGSAFFGADDYADVVRRVRENTTHA